MTRSEVLAACHAAGLAPHDAVALIRLATERGLVDWVGMSADGQPLYRVRLPMYVSSPRRL